MTTDNARSVEPPAVVIELSCIECAWSTRTPFPACLEELVEHECGGSNAA